MAENDTWLTLGEAVAATGWKPERIRSLARRGTMPRKRGNTRDWLYQVTPELVAACAGTTADPRVGTIEAARSEAVAARAGTDEAARWQAVAAELQEEVAELRVQLARAEGEVRTAQAETVAKDQVIEEIRTQIAREITRGDALAGELAEARRPWWRRLLG